MASLTEQMEMLQKQQAILAEKIKEEEERNKKLNQEASIERLEALIEPITQHLDWVPVPRHSHRVGRNPSYRQSLNIKFDSQMKDRRNDPRQPSITKYQSSHMLANEEIFITLLGIIKKQEARISNLESTVLEYY